MFALEKLKIARHASQLPAERIKAFDTELYVDVYYYWMKPIENVIESNSWWILIENNSWYLQLHPPDGVLAWEIGYKCWHISVTLYESGINIDKSAGSLKERYFAM